MGLAKRWKGIDGPRMDFIGRELKEFKEIIESKRAAKNAVWEITCYMEEQLQNRTKCWEKKKKKIFNPKAMLLKKTDQSRK